MAYDSAFSPFGPTYLVSTSAVQVKTTSNFYPTSYRIYNITSGIVRFAWAPQEPGDATVTPVVTTPTATGTLYVMSIPANTVQVFSGIPSNAWFISNTASSLEITPGEGKL
jgi:hypothetical protein